MSNSRKKITLRDVAKKAGVSAATVSLVMQGKGTLKAETRMTVERVIDEIGYQRRSGQNVSSGNKQFVLVVDDVENPYFHALYKGLDQSLGEAGHYVTLMSSNDSVERQSRLLESLWSTEIGGVVLVPATGTTNADLHPFQNRLRPLILAVRRIGPTVFDYVGANPMVGMQIATERLIELGHKKISFIGGYQANYAYNERYAGFAASLMKHGIDLNTDWVLNGGSNREFGRQAMRQLLSMPNAPKALIAYNDVVAIGAMNAISAVGLMPGKDVAVIGYDDIPEAALQAVPLTSVATPADSLGEVIGRAILARSGDGVAGSPLDITYPPRLVTRKSCGKQIVEPQSLDRNILNEDTDTF